jgi:hypothetical protein
VLGRADLRAHLLTGAESVASLALEAQQPPTGAVPIVSLAPCALDRLPPGATAASLGASLWRQGNAWTVTFAEVVAQPDLAFILNLDVSQALLQAQPYTVVQILCSLGIGALGCATGTAGNGCGGCVPRETMQPIPRGYGCLFTGQLPQRC